MVVKFYLLTIICLYITGCTYTSAPEPTFSWYVFNKSDFPINISIYHRDRSSSNTDFVLDTKISRNLTAGDSLFEVDVTYNPFFDTDKKVILSFLRDPNFCIVFSDTNNGNYDIRNANNWFRDSLDVFRYTITDSLINSDLISNCSSIQSN